MHVDPRDYSERSNLHSCGNAVAVWNWQPVYGRICPDTALRQEVAEPYMFSWNKSVLVVQLRTHNIPVEITAL